MRENGACNFSLFQSKVAVRKWIAFHGFERYSNKNTKKESGKHTERALRISAHSEEFEALPQKKRLVPYFLIVTVTFYKIRLKKVTFDGPLPPSLVYTETEQILGLVEPNIELFYFFKPYGTKCYRSVDARHKDGPL